MSDTAAEQQKSAPRRGKIRGAKVEGTQSAQNAQSTEGATESAAVGAALSRIARRTSERLAKRGFCPVPSYFLANYYRLPPPVAGQRGLTSTEALLIVHLLDFKWDEHHPFPSVEMLATRMGMSKRMIRRAMSHLEECKLVERIIDRRRANRYDLSGLFVALERLMDADSSREAGEAVPAAA